VRHVTARDCAACPVRHVDLIREADAKKREALIARFTHVFCPVRAVLYAEAQTSSAVHIVRAGLLKLVRYLPNGAERIVRLVHVGDTIGLESVLGEPYRHSAIAMTDAQTCSIPAALLQDRYEGHPELAAALLVEWQKSLDTADRFLTELTAGTAQERVARFLIYLTEKVPGSQCHLMTREDIGSLLAMTTETASRVIADFKRRGIVEELPDGQHRCDVPALRIVAGA
jgi:CRP-like cAMP-binding protein